AWDILTSEAPFSLVISDLSMPNMDGFELLERIRHTHLPHISSLPVIVITGANDSEVIKERAILAGATDFIGKPFDSVHLLARAQAHASAHSNARTLKEETLALEDSAAIDPLTRIANETAFMERGYQQLAYAVRHNTRLSVFHIEVDNYGHLYKTHGDSIAKNIVRTVASALTTDIRQEDTAARIGTARFAMLLPAMNNHGIHNLADRIRKNIRERVLKHGTTRIHYTLSIGVAAMEIRRDTRFDDLLSMASNRLAYACAHGGDQVVYGDKERMAPTGQPDKKVATVGQPECIDEMDIQVEAIDIDQQPIPDFPQASPDNDPPVIECRSTAKPALAPGTANTAGSIDSVKTSSAPDQVTPAPLYVPDLSLAPGQKAAGSRPEESTADEVIVIAAASNPSIEPKPDWKIPEATTGTVDAPAGQTSNENAKTTHNPVIQLADINTLRPGILERILMRIWSFFWKSKEPE
ncbi:MAG: diguanylate cyclase, partial [Gammaproteobacteria bacterium]|nr:diguanylate cyclase [Gammaproteobacteria bacterium]